MCYTQNDKLIIPFCVTHVCEVDNDYLFTCDPSLKTFLRSQCICNPSKICELQIMPSICMCFPEYSAIFCNCNHILLLLLLLPLLSFVQVVFIFLLNIVLQDETVAGTWCCVLFLQPLIQIYVFKCQLSSPKTFIHTRTWMHRYTLLT